MKIQALTSQRATLTDEIKDLQTAINSGEYDADFTERLQNELNGKKDSLSNLEKQIIEATPKEVRNAQCADGKDDGSIGFWGGLKNFGKGVGNFFKNMICDENGFSLKRTLITAGTAVAVGTLCFVTAGTAVPFIVAGAGAAMGAVQAGKGIYKVATAKTDAEAEAAWQDIGEGTITTGLSIAGMKAAKTANAKLNGGKFSILGNKGVTKGQYQILKTKINEKTGLSKIKEIRAEKKAELKLKELEIQEKELLLKKNNSSLSKPEQTKLRKIQEELRPHRKNTTQNPTIKKAEGRIAKAEERIAKAQEEIAKAQEKIDTTKSKNVKNKQREIIKNKNKEIKTTEKEIKIANEDIELQKAPKDYTTEELEVIIESYNGKIGGYKKGDPTRSDLFKVKNKELKTELYKRKLAKLKAEKSKLEFLESKKFLQLINPVDNSKKQALVSASALKETLSGNLFGTSTAEQQMSNSYVTLNSLEQKELAKYIMQTKLEYPNLTQSQIKELCKKYVEHIREQRLAQAMEQMNA